MFEFMQRFTHDSHAGWRGTRPLNRVRRRNHRLNCEALESRQLLSGYYIVNDQRQGARRPGGLDQQRDRHRSVAAVWRGQPGWTLVAAGNAPVVTNYVVNASSGKVLDDPDSSTSNGTPIQQYQLNLGSNQQWAFIPLADGDDLIVNASSGKVLDDPNSSTSNGTTVIQYQLNGGTNQQWKLVALTDGN